MRLKAVITGILCFLSALHAQIQLQSAFPSLTFTKPLDIQAPLDGTDRLAIVTQPGIIYIFPNSPSVSSAKTFLDIRDSVYAVGYEQGLLGLAFHPQFSSNRYIFVNYTAKPNGRTVVARYTVSATNADSVDKSSRLVILEVNQPYENHNGGQVAFGPDGYLYVGMGDGGSGGDPQNNAQNNTQLLGKFLRINVDVQAEGNNYAIPDDNPFVGNGLGYREEIFAYGLRNPWRFSFDPVTQWLWAADVGQNAWEEIDIIESGKNYGWRIMEGNHCYPPSVTNCNQTGLTLPIWEYDRSAGVSVTGGHVYRGAAIPELYGKYVYGDFGSGRIWFLSYDGTNPPVNSLFIATGFSISSFGLDQHRELYLTAFDGKVYKFVKGSTSVPHEDVVHSFELRQNYPNPFNPGTTIEFSLPSAKHVTITIYDVTGKEVLKLAEEEFFAGVHKVHWTGRNQADEATPSGVYFYRLKAGNQVETGRMVLLK